MIPVPNEIIAAEAFIRAGGGVAIFSDDEAGQRVMRWLAEHCQADPDDWEWVGVARAEEVRLGESGNVEFYGNATGLWKFTQRDGRRTAGIAIPGLALTAVIAYEW
mgnify:CR=1 FL=1